MDTHPDSPSDDPPVGSAITMGLQQFEQRLERLVEGAFTKAFRGGVQPVEIARRITREMDLLRRLGVRGPIAPNVFTVSLSPEDGEQFESFADAMAHELADAAREHAREEGYTFVGPVEVTLMVDEAFAPGRFEVEAEVQEGSLDLPPAFLVMGDGRRIPIGAEPLVIGRLPECSVHVPDPNVSRRHAEVRRQGEMCVISDLNSTNGTLVNGMRVTETALVSGDRISVGAATIRFETS